MVIAPYGLERGFSKGHPCRAPVGHIRSNPKVLGAASGDKTLPFGMVELYII